MSHKIYQNSIRTQSGRGVVRIYDEKEDELTPDFHDGEIHGGIKLEQGDSGNTSDEFPKSIGSYFKLTFTDTKDRDFQKLFANVGDETRLQVEFDVPGFDTWMGTISRELKQRKIGYRTRENLTSVTCYDGLGRLKDIGRIQNAFDLTIREFLVEALGYANPNVPIKLYIDVACNSPNEPDTTVAGYDRMYPHENISVDYAPWSGSYKGLEGGNVRAQLDQLCEKVHATCFYDITIGAWKFVDVASVGVGIGSGNRVQYYNGSNWKDSTLDEQSVSIDRNEVAIENEEGILEELPATNEACFDIQNWAQDPKQEQYDASGTDELFLYPGHTALVQATSADVDTYSEIIFGSGTNEYVDAFTFLDIDVEDITHIRFRGDFKNTRAADKVISLNADIDYGDGTTDTISGLYTGGGLDQDPAYFKVDETKDVIQRFDVRIVTSGSITERMYEIAIEMVTSVNETKPDGTTENVYKVVDTVCYRDKGDPGRKYEGKVHSFIISEPNGSKISSEGFFSQRYKNVFYLSRWKAINRTSLQTSRTEKIKARVTPAIIPLGHKIRYTKPDENVQSHFVHLDSRVLHFATSDMDKGTEISDMEIPSKVIGKIPK